MKKILVISLALLLAIVMIIPMAFPAAAEAGGFDQYGYNRTARIFNGTAESWSLAEGWTEAQAEAYWGVYLHDKLIMKWNAEWDRGNAEDWANPPYKAWEDNEFNGRFPGGSGEVWHYKIVWVGPTGLANFTPMPNGGYSIWGQFEVIMDQGQDPNTGPGHLWFAHAAPAGYGEYSLP